MQPYFRDAVRGDVPAIAAILRESNGIGDDIERRMDEHGGSTPIASYQDALDEIDRASGNFALVAEYDRQIVAILQLLAFRHLHGHGGRTAEIVGLHVAPSYRTTGIAGMLLEHAIDRCRDLGCSRLQVLSSTARSDEHPFWERLGFVQLDRGYARPL